MIAVVCLDALSLPRTERLLAEGRMPALAALRERGATRPIDETDGLELMPGLGLLHDADGPPAGAPRPLLPLRLGSGRPAGPPGPGADRAQHLGGGREGGPPRGGDRPLRGGPARRAGRRGGDVGMAAAQPRHAAARGRSRDRGGGAAARPRPRAHGRRDLRAAVAALAQADERDAGTRARAAGHRGGAARPRRAAGPALVPPGGGSRGRPRAVGQLAAGGGPVAGAGRARRRPRSPLRADRRRAGADRRRGRRGRDAARHLPARDGPQPEPQRHAPGDGRRGAGRRAGYPGRPIRPGCGACAAPSRRRCGR